MQGPGRLPFYGDRRVAFTRTLRFNNRDLTGATFAMQVRLTPDTPGTPLADLETVASASAEGVRLISAGLLDGVMTSFVGIRINKTTMATMPAAAELGETLELAWDMLITPIGSLEDKWLYGPFFVRGTVVQ